MRLSLNEHLSYAGDFLSRTWPGRLFLALVVLCIALSFDWVRLGDAVSIGLIIAAVVVAILLVAWPTPHSHVAMTVKATVNALLAIIGVISAAAGLGQADVPFGTRVVALIAIPWPALYPIARDTARLQNEAADAAFKAAGQKFSGIPGAVRARTFRVYAGAVALTSGWVGVAVLALVLLLGPPAPVYIPVVLADALLVWRVGHELSKQWAPFK